MLLFKFHDVLKKQKYFLIVLTYLSFYNITFSSEILSSNGNNFFRYSSSKSRVENIDLDFYKNSYDINYIKFGFFLDGKQYEVGEKEYKTEKIGDANIIKIKGEFEKISYEINLYSSMLNKKNVVIHTTFEKSSNLEEVQFYYYIKPKDLGIIEEKESGYKFNDWYFRSSKKIDKIYLGDETEAKEKVLRAFKDKIFLESNQGIFVLIKFDKNENYENYFYFNKNSEDYYTNSIDDEQNFWEKSLENIKEKSLYSNLFMFAKGKIFVDISGENPLVNMEEMLKYLELCLLQKRYAEAKQIIEYFIFETDKNIQGIIPGDYLDLDGKEYYKKDNYGIYKSYYRPAIFLDLYIKYLKESKDEQLYNESFSIVKERLIDWLVTHYSEKGMDEDSGNSRIGIDGAKRFVETQFEVYKAFKSLDEFLIQKNMRDNKYKKISDSLKELLIVYYIDNKNIADYPFSKEINPKNIFYTDETLFFSVDDYYVALQTNIDLLKNRKNSLKEKIKFVNYLYDKKYYLMAEALQVEVENELNGENRTEIMQNDLSLLINYLIMKEKGEKYGVNK